jgi:hypothetical protein
MGLVAWYNTSIVTSFFASLNVSLAKTDIFRAGFTSLTEVPVDFETGRRVENLDAGNQTLGLQNYIAQLAKYPYLETGFDLPSPIPPDLLLPFGEFVEKYNISGAVYVIIEFLILHPPILKMGACI